MPPFGSAFLVNNHKAPVWDNSSAAPLHSSIFALDTILDLIRINPKHTLTYPILQSQGRVVSRLPLNSHPEIHDS